MFNNLLVCRHGCLPLVRAQYQLLNRCLHGYLCHFFIHYFDPFWWVSHALRPTHRAESRLLLDILILELPVARPGSIGSIEASHRLLSQGCITLCDIAALMHLELICLLLPISDTRGVNRVTIGRYVVLQEDILFLEIGWALQKLQVVNELERRLAVIWIVD